MAEDTRVPVDLDPHYGGEVLTTGLALFGGPKAVSESLIHLVGYADARDLQHNQYRLLGEVSQWCWLGPVELTPSDWRRALVITEITLGSEVFGVPREWADFSGLVGMECWAALRRLQQRLRPIVSMPEAIVTISGPGETAASDSGLDPADDIPVDVQLPEDELALLIGGHDNWPPREDAHLAATLGYETPQEITAGIQRLDAALASGTTTLMRSDWRRVLAATELNFASSVWGLGDHWGHQSGKGSLDDLPTLQRLQESLFWAHALKS